MFFCKVKRSYYNIFYINLDCNCLVNDCIIAFIWQHLVCKFTLPPYMEGSSRFTKMFCTVLVPRIQCMASRSSPQDILTLFGIQCLCLHNLPILICPHPRCLSDSRGVHLNRFRYANARNQRDLTSPELHQHSYKSFCRSIIAESSQIFCSTIWKDSRVSIW